MSGKHITHMKVGIGAIDHHTLQVESPEEVAALVKRALQVIPKERLILSSDCGMGREGMTRRHAFYKMVALVQGVNLVKQELGLPVTPSQAADPKFSLIRGRLLADACNARDGGAGLVGQDAGRVGAGDQRGPAVCGGRGADAHRRADGRSPTAQGFTLYHTVRGGAGGPARPGGGAGDAAFAALARR